MSSSEFFTEPALTNGYSGFKLLHESGFNALYIAQREGKKFAIKALTGVHRGDILYESLMRKEFEIGYSLDHPNICRTLSFEQFPEVGNAIVMEWIDGRTLDEYIAEKQHSFNELQRIVEQLCTALSYAHKRQTIHRDLKPQNIIITHNGDNVKLLDFGLSDTDSHVAFKEPAGSRKYASPELQRGDEIDSLSDIYSLGIIIDELYKGMHSRKIATIVTRATAYYPTSRYPDAEAISTAIKSGGTKLLYPILALILAAIAYLFYFTAHSSEALIPSAEADGVSIEEFDRRQALCNDFFRAINDNYLTLMNDGVYKMDCTTPELPNFEELSRKQITLYEKMLDSMLADIKRSSLYRNARRNMASHNRELFTIMQSSFPALFWNNTEQLFKNADDSLALELKKLPAPKYEVASPEQQQAEFERYEKATQEHKKTTIEVWAIEHRKSHNLSPLPTELLNYY